MILIRRNILAILCLWLLATTGCHRVPASWYYTFNGYPDDPPDSPAKRLEHYQQLTDMAGEMTVLEQELLSQQLAQALMNDPDPLIRAQIVRALGVMDTKTASGALFSALNDRHQFVRIACCKIWGRRGGSDAKQALSGVLRSDRDVDVRLAAISALGDLKDQSIIPMLAIALEDNDVAIQNRAMVSLENLTGRYYGKDVNAWRAFAGGQEIPEKERSLAERLKRYF